MPNMISGLSANEIDILVTDRIKRYNVHGALKDMELVDPAHQLEVLNQSLGKTDNLYYQWLAVLTQLMQPKQVVELGAAAGISTIMIARELPDDSKFYSVDNDPQSWRWISKEYPQLIKVLGNDLDLTVWPDGTLLDNTDLWFIDSLHEEQQLRAEIELYSKFWKKGAVVVFDDVRINPGMSRVWDELTYDKCETTHPLHYTGFGHLVV